MKSPTPMKLTAKNLSFGHSRVLQQEINFSLNAGECLWISGPNGSGKTLLGRVLAGFHPYQGSLEGSFRKISYLPQVQEPINHLPFRLKDITPKDQFLSVEQMQLSWNTASGGERQKALLDRTFAQKGDLIILDEPFNHLDQSSKEQLQLYLNQHFSDGKAALILISHDIQPNLWWKRELKTLSLRGAE